MTCLVPYKDQAKVAVQTIKQNPILTQQYAAAINKVSKSTVWAHQCGRTARRLEKSECLACLYARQLTQQHGRQRVLCSNQRVVEPWFDLVQNAKAKYGRHESSLVTSSHSNPKSWPVKHTPHVTCHCHSGVFLVTWERFVAQLREPMVERALGFSVVRRRRDSRAASCSGVCRGWELWI
ncbi:hypothetical protein BU25DRAFT_249276 [Macroventuria anomochaeta]|uniref:Uncharacterized protein n=1 Tax=Macroventuria anomochaeta TaxID=301207 RepID=A0ACB6SB79_9PLEO|nr:uncharacterized protein BU25DRAFT_249276 [Macroventuria anomochaeta]KAF2630850.1 hypothetical protein BU25DRAFT_249276 [Macroventuria anomochaeta]